jgi:hypothetical protein
MLIIDSALCRMARSRISLSYIYAIRTALAFESGVPEELCYEKTRKPRDAVFSRIHEKTHFKQKSTSNFIICVTNIYQEEEIDVMSHWRNFMVFFLP